MSPPSLATAGLILVSKTSKILLLFHRDLSAGYLISSFKIGSLLFQNNGLGEI